jgi:hypothetical protein
MKVTARRVDLQEPSLVLLMSEAQHSVRWFAGTGVVTVGVVSTGVLGAAGVSARLADMVPMRPIAKANANNRTYANQRIVSMTGTWKSNLGANRWQGKAQ